MCRSTCFVVTGSVIASLLLMTSSAEAQQKPIVNSAQNWQLPKATLQKLEKIVLPAWQRDDESAFMESVLELIQQSSVDQFEEIETLRFQQRDSIHSKRVLQTDCA